MGDKKYVLAMYDVRGKQDFIFRTNKLKEIVGASWLIRDVFEDYLFPAAQKVHPDGKGIYSYKRVSGENEGSARFTEEGFKDRLGQGYLGEVVYDGGGNFLVLFRDEDTFREVTSCFTEDVMKETGTLRILATCVEIDDFSDYRRDNQRLRSKHSQAEGQESMIAPWVALPIVQVDRKTSQPYVDFSRDPEWGTLPAEVRGKITAAADRGKLTRERYAKLRKYEKTLYKYKENPGEFEKEYFNTNEIVFDNLVPQKGVDSMLAVVYIDGNGMGAKVEKATSGKVTYEESIASLRDFSASIQKIYVEDGIRSALGGEEKRNHRLVVYAGDEVNFVVAGRDAMDCARAYIDGLQKNEGASACAGIAVFHSHSPYADAYRIAEECCESGKKLMKEKKLENACFIDFHLIQGGVGTSLEDARDREGTVHTSRPWLVGDSQDSTITTMKMVDELVSLFRNLGRTNVKTLAEVAKNDKNQLLLELLRIRAHLSDNHKDTKAAIKEYTDRLKDSDTGDAIANLIYDVVISYDLWFKNGEENRA